MGVIRARVKGTWAYVRGLIVALVGRDILHEVARTSIMYGYSLGLQRAAEVAEQVMAQQQGAEVVTVEAVNGVQPYSGIGDADGSN